MKRALAAVGFAAAILLGAVLFLSAAADNHENDLENDPVEKLWDTDNLLYTANTGSVSARTFGVPFHEYDGYRSVEAKACVDRGSGGNPSLRPQNEAGVCPSGHSLIAQVCAYGAYLEYGGFRDEHGRYVPSVLRPSSYRVKAHTM